jgi:hypothetical protein
MRPTYETHKGLVIIQLRMLSKVQLAELVRLVRQVGGLQRVAGYTEHASGETRRGGS